MSFTAGTAGDVRRRPPVVEERLPILADGYVSYRPKKRYRDGSSHVVLDSVTFLERLCALGLRPRRMSADACLARLAVEGDAVRTEATSFGQKYEVRGNLTNPSGRIVTIVSVWIVLSGEAQARFVTAFPANKS